MHSSLPSTAPPAATENKAAAPSHWLGWAVYLGVSWTWCIGMFLPVILVRDYGFWAWVIFAIPNVAGAAAMGWVLKSRQSSEEIARIHEPACRVFSAVTIAFHLFFAVAVIAPLASSITTQGRSLATVLSAIFIIAMPMYVYMTRRGGGDRVLAWVTLAISLAVWGALYGCHLAGVSSLKLAPLNAAVHIDLLWLAPVCIFGFLCCPYLDLTFHRARQFSSAPRNSFGAGFGVVFLSMIVFTLFYARAFLADGISGWIAVFLVMHLSVQSAYTIAAHARELRFRGEAYAILAAALALGAWLFYWFLSDGPLIGKLQGPEVIYRTFLGFYGLVFPTYVWLVMLPGRGRNSPTLWTLVVFAVALIGALPMFWMGFVAQRLLWVIPGLCIVLLARMLVKAPAPNLRV